MGNEGREIGGGCIVLLMRGTRGGVGREEKLRETSPQVRETEGDNNQMPLFTTMGEITVYLCPNLLGR